MAYKNKYQLMDYSEVTDENGNNYPDLATFPLNELRLTSKPSNYQLNQNNLFRFYDLMYDYYDEFDFYDDINLWLNNITEIYDEDENFGKTINLYGKTDLDKWYREFLKEM